MYVFIEILYVFYPNIWLKLYSHFYNKFQPILIVPPAKSSYKCETINVPSQQTSRPASHITVRSHKQALSFATMVGTPQQHMPITVGAYHLNPPVNPTPSGGNRVTFWDALLRMDDLRFRKIFNLGITKDISGKKLSKLEKLQSLVVKCCKIRKI